MSPVSGSPHLPSPAEFAAKYRGHLVRPGDAQYEDLRKVHNGLIDKRPVAIARCHDVRDVADAVRFARDHKLEVAVRGGGHNVAGRATIDNGLLIDLSAMKDVTVDPVARTARAQGGVTWGEYNRATQAHGLASTGGVVSTTGVSGLTLGGGMGWLLGRHGYAVDNLLSAEIVTADGGVLTANDRENTDLFWAVRGGGGNFGIAASLEFRVHPIGPTITGGLLAHPFGVARDLLRFYRDVTGNLPDDFTVYAGLIHSPDGAAKLAGILACHCGAPVDGAQAIAPIKRFGSPIMDALGPLGYCDLNTMLDAGYPKGALNYWKSSFLTELSDDAIEAMIDAYARCPSPATQLIIEHIHGAAARVPATAAAFPLRATGCNFLLLGQWMNPTDTDRCLRWARETYAAMQPFMAPLRYVNYLDSDESGDPAAAAYGPNYRRLRELKAKFDPDNFFHMNQNIKPGTFQA